MFFSFKNPFNRRTVTPTLEFDEGYVSTFAKFKYERGSSKVEHIFEKTNTISHFPFYKVRQPSKLEVRFMLKCCQLGGKGRG